jgi:hypothetical protein
MTTGSGFRTTLLAVIEDVTSDEPARLCISTFGFAGVESCKPFLLSEAGWLELYEVVAVVTQCGHFNTLAFSGDKLAIKSPKLCNLLCSSWGFCF